MEDVIYGTGRCIHTTVRRLAILPRFMAHFPSMKSMKKLIWLLPQLIILGALLVAVEIKGSPPTNEITISYGNLFDTRGHVHSVQLVLHPNGSVTWRDLTHHIR
jgi:hypothetical protein